MNNLIFLGKRIQLARKELGFKNREAFAKELGINLKKLESYEQGKEPPPLDIIKYICYRLNVGIRAFIYGKIDNIEFRGKNKLFLSDEIKINIIKDGLETLIENDFIHYNRLDFIGLTNPIKTSRKFIEYYNLFNDNFNIYEYVINILAKIDIFVFALPLKSKISALIHKAEPFFIVLNSNEPEDRWSFSLLHEIGHIIVPKEFEEDKEKYSDLFAENVLIPEDFIYYLWRKLKYYVKNRKYETFFQEVRKISNKVSPEAVFYVLVKNFEYDWSKFGQFRKKAKMIREKERIENTRKIFIPDKYKNLIEKMYQEDLITEKRKKEILLW